MTFEGCQIVSDRSHGSCDALVRPGQSGKSFIIIKNDGGWDEIFHNIVLKKVGAGFLFRVKGIRTYNTVYVVVNAGNIRNHYTDM